ncbi:MAG: DUF222 domain-containing protein, partial [Actinomycetota bacterium]
MPAEMPVPGIPPGLSWSWEMDFGALLACTGGAASPAADADDDEAAQEAVLDAVDRDGPPMSAGVLAARVAERLPPGPDLTAWLATAPAADLTDYDLAGAASSWRRIASWAQSQELAVAAQIASRAAARDKDIETDADGRPARVSAAAAAEVALSLTMSQYGASGWTELGVDLQWRLAATGKALAAGLIDLPRARLISEATSMLTDAAAQAVEERVLSAAGKQTTGSLRAVLRRAVIAVDPDGAERRRKEAERRAKVGLYPGEEGTSTITANGLPTVMGAAAMARITAMARAMKAAGAPGGIDLLRAQIFVGLLLGTLPLIPPAKDAPPDDEPGPDPQDDPGSDPGSEPGSGPGSDPGGEPGSDSGPGPQDGRDGEPGSGPDTGCGGRPGGGPAPGNSPEGGPGSDAGGSSGTGPEGGPGGGSCGDGPWDGFPDPLDEDAPDSAHDDLSPSDIGLTGRYSPSREYRPRGYRPVSGSADEDYPGPRDYDDWPQIGPIPDWPALPGLIPPVPPGLAAPDASRPISGMLDISMPWQTLAGLSPEPGYLGRIGPISALQARQLANCASRDPGTIWRIIVTNRDGQALAVTRLPRRRVSGTDEPGGLSPGDGAGLIGRMTLIIPENILAPGSPPLLGSDLPGILLRALEHAAKALAAARATAQADTAAGGCAHLGASEAYRAPPRLREYIAARDITCRFLTCRQPVWCCDLDHTTPYDQGGPTCKCN